MPLSDHEQQLLDQLEQQLSAEDPRFVSHMRGSASVRRGRLVAAVIAVLVGLAMVLGGVNLSQIWLGALGFALMVAGVSYAVAPQRQSTPSVSAAHPSVRGKTARGKAPKKSGGLMDRLESRWDRRRGPS